MKTIREKLHEIVLPLIEYFSGQSEDGSVVVTEEAFIRLSRAISHDIAKQIEKNHLTEEVEQ